ncbi:sulfite exporter TauE/SafE family protein [Fulvivirga lutea]|uniref:Probable membrane transporter protein n=1 Tax=Fulvivirga lutea TaxID=2810512 RepID=A0A974WFY5_9BACT|nr:sulfite exporter TauE/SafE family protein [Fulvivirga lutea]QSE97546.1 sulfite exporter TauE/SafE family protein [Fulvivirga lutea]
MIIYTLLFIAGLIGGLLAGITGVGTGFIMIAVIPLALANMGIPDVLIVQLTIANTIFATMCSSFLNNVQLMIKRKMYWNETFILAMVAGATASILLQLIVYNSTYSKEAYNTIIIVLLAYIIIRTLSKLRKRLEEKENITLPKLIVTGISGGAVAALTGLGGGSMVIPMLNLWMKVDIIKAKKISYGTIFITSLLLTFLNIVNKPSIELSYSHIGFILFPVALPLAAGVIIGSPLGLKLGEKTPARVISYLFLTIIGIVMLRKIIELL